jgi:hypothetical protein
MYLPRLDLSRKQTGFIYKVNWIYLESKLDLSRNSKSPSFSSPLLLLPVSLKKYLIFNKLINLQIVQYLYISHYFLQVIKMKHSFKTQTKKMKNYICAWKKVDLKRNIFLTFLTYVMFLHFLGKSS